MPDTIYNFDEMYSFPVRFEITEFAPDVKSFHIFFQDRLFDLRAIIERYGLDGILQLKEAHLMRYSHLHNILDDFNDDPGDYLLPDNSVIPEFVDLKTAIKRLDKNMRLLDRLLNNIGDCMGVKFRSLTVDELKSKNPYLLRRKHPVLMQELIYAAQR